MIKGPITISPCEEYGSGFDVSYEGRTAYGLGWDEMIAQVIEIAHPGLGKPRIKMETPEDHAAELQRREDRDAARAAAQEGKTP